jgi:taurine transport system ATP-binding protein
MSCALCEQDYDTSPIISIEDISVVFGSEGNELTTLSGVNMKIYEGDFVCLLGPSGCGKTTLLNVIAGLVKATSGVAKASGEPISGPSWTRGVVFQTPSLYPWLDVKANVEFGLKIRKFDKKTRFEMADKWLAKVGLTDFKNHKTYELSGGMRQRVALARVLVNNPRVVLFDEPFGALDAFTRKSMQFLTRAIWADSKSTFFLITHDVDEALSLGTRILVMSDRPGRILKDYKAEFTYFITESDNDRTRFSKEYIELRERILMEIHDSTSGQSSYTL